MSLSTAIAACFGKYATFSGRASRSEYWWFLLFVVVVNMLLTVLDSTLFNGQQILSGVWSLATVLPVMAVMIRRLHDTNRSGWWWLIELTVIGVIPLFIWLCRAGDVLPNRFGPPSLTNNTGATMTGIAV